MSRKKVYLFLFRFILLYSKIPLNKAITPINSKDNTVFSVVGLPTVWGTKSIVNQRLTMLFSFITYPILFSLYRYLKIKIPIFKLIYKVNMK